ncbi:MAG TPA: NAD(P)-dependent alcohol dehydrogenase [Verrucomicrobiae bacterium]|jgi:NADPH:quinone reductase-like Zn-dependent oxidoreductase|nr:NAD(P)-dependent alcohol dehydrogenase [Verrucomicrobiae bacterium]
MKAYKIFESGQPSLRLIDLPEPKPGPGQVVVRVRAASLNYRDLMVLTGRYGDMRLPIIPLSDGAGEITAIGEGVTRWKTGDRVAGLFFQGWHTGPFRREMGHTALGGELDGMLAESVALDQDGVIAIPSHMNFAEAASLPCAGLTAWHALVTVGNISADQTVLLLGTGGVSIFGLQFAKMHGARVIITSGSDEKLARARALGADETINYRATSDWEKEVFRLTGKAGADHVVEVGGQNTLGKSLASLAMGGQVHIVGGVSGFTTELPLFAVLGRAAVIRGIRVGSREMFEAMNRAMTLHKTKPAVDKVFEFQDAPAAYQFLQDGKHFGKVVITI